MLEPNRPAGGTIGTLCTHESKAKDSEKFTNLVFTSNAFPGTPGRESVQGLVKTCLEMGAVDLDRSLLALNLFDERSMRLGLSTGVAAEIRNGLESGYQNHVKGQMQQCKLRSATPKILIANPPCPLFLKVPNDNIGISHQLESTENTVFTTRSHLIFAVRECFEQIHCGDHFLFEYPSNASSWNKLCVQKVVAQPCVVRDEGSMCRWHLLSG